MVNCVTLTELVGCHDKGKSVSSINTRIDSDPDIFRGIHSYEHSLNLAFRNAVPLSFRSLALANSWQIKKIGHKLLLHYQPNDTPYRYEP